MMLGDALSAPLHWIYTWSQAQRIKREHLSGGLCGFAASPAAARHPDSHKYFSRCSPQHHPVPAIFGAPEAASQWATPGTFYHATLPAGDNTLTARLVARLVGHVGENAGLDMDAWLAKGYLPLLLRQGGSAASHSDTWVDETHRVLFENLAAGARAWEAGMDDLCLTGINLCLPVLLAYGADRDAQELACRCLLQLTHKNEDMVQQCMWWGDLLREVLGRHTSGSGSGSGSSSSSVQQAIGAVFSSFSPLDLPDILSQGLSEAAVYHGDEETGAKPLFSSR